MRTKKHKVDAKLSRKQIREWLYQYPKSVWWISNNQIADSCRISSQEKQHATSILGRFLSHNEIFLECSLSKWVKMQMHCACHCVLHLIHCIYCLLVMFLALFCLHSRNQHHMWTCLTGLGNSRGWQLCILHTHNASVLWSCVSAWVRECIQILVCVRESTGRCLGVLIQLLLSVCEYIVSACE